MYPDNQAHWNTMMASRANSDYPRRRASDNDASSNGVLSIIKTILSTSGPLALMAIGLAGFLAWSVWGRLDEIERNQAIIIDSMQRANVAMSSYVAVVNEQNRAREELLRQQIRLLSQVCRNTVERDSQVSLCD